MILGLRQLAALHETAGQPGMEPGLFHTDRGLAAGPPSYPFANRGVDANHCRREPERLAFISHLPELSVLAATNGIQGLQIRFDNRRCKPERLPTNHLPRPFRTGSSQRYPRTAEPFRAFYGRQVYRQVLAQLRRAGDQEIALDEAKAQSQGWRTDANGCVNGCAQTSFAQRSHLISISVVAENSNEKRLFSSRLQTGF